MRRNVQVTFLLFLALIAWEWIFVREGWSRGVLLLAMGLAVVLMPLGAALAREALVRLNLWGVPVLILGAGKTGALVARKLREDKVLGLLPVAFLDDDPAKWGTLLEGVPVTGGLEEMEKFQKMGVRHAILAMPGAGRNRLAALLHSLPFHQVVLIPDLFGLQSLWVSSWDLSGVLGLEIRKNLLLRRNQLLKRALDYLLGLPLTLLALPVMGLAALWIKWVSPGPAFYTQEREGYRG